jgi:hypothetical protein
MSTLITDIPQHDGSKKTYKPFRELVLEFCSTACGLFPFGLLAFLLPPAEYAVLTQVIFHPFPDPGAVQPLLAQPWKVWEFATNKFNAQQTAIMEFRKVLIAALSTDLLEHIKVPIHGLRLLSIAQLLAAADAMYGVLTTADIRANEDALLIPFVDDGSMKVSTFTATHKHHHTIAFENHNEIQEPNKVYYLKTAMQPCGQFEPVITLFEAQFSSALAQHFDVFSERLIDFDNNRVKQVTVGTIKYAAAVTRIPARPAPVQPSAAVAPPSSQEDTNSAAILLAAAAIITAHNAAAAPTTQPARKPRTTNSSMLYCWTHGQCLHNGVDCTLKAPGHKDNATSGHNQSSSP